MAERPLPAGVCIHDLLETCSGMFYDYIMFRKVVKNMDTPMRTGSSDNGVLQCATVSDEIFRLLHYRILSGFYKRGQHLSEVQLATELNISRSPIREAFIQLENTGLVKIVKRKGVFVFDFTEADVHEIAEMRLLVELHIMKVLIEENRINDRALERLESIVRDMKNLQTSLALNDTELNYQESRLDFMFHLAIAELAERPSFYDLVKRTLTRSRAIIGLSNAQPDTGQVLEDHIQLIEALRQKDEEQAQKIVRRHLRWMLREEPGSHHTV
ncbi:GntR family transcriptional regulator [Bacilliculturomica massiliensis]|uniref:GntR family transcriptional regulator n=1 Tax=Bacilliculturomica massiliensis TaxID=1917867 RepID=UPI00103075DE